MNPFTQKSKTIDETFLTFTQMYPKPYDKKTASPFTKLRVILTTGAEFESTWFLHQLARNCADPDIKREVAVIRNQEQQQQKRLGALKPLDENILETTIGYEQLAIELTAILAKNEKDANNIDALNFALLEDFDHLYRFANLLKMDFGIEAETMVGKLTEIMPGRPTIAEHRHPRDFIKPHFNAKTADPYSKLCASIITAAEQQTMNWYMNIAQIYHNDLGRKLFSEIAMVEEMHVSQYECLADPTCSWLEKWLLHEYTECYLYYSAYMDETDADIKAIFKSHFEMEVAHLKKAAEILEKYEKKSAASVIPNPEFPTLLKFNQNKDFVRKVINDTVWLTSDREKYVDARKMKKTSDFYKHNTYVCGKDSDVPSHAVIVAATKAKGFGGTDYRYTDKPHPIKELDDRKTDNTTVGRVS